MVELPEAAASAASAYDPFKREPRFAGAEHACLWELAPLALHFHPSVRAFADAVLTSPATPLSVASPAQRRRSRQPGLTRY